MKLFGVYLLLSLFALSFLNSFWSRKLFDITSYLVTNQGWLVLSGYIIGSVIGIILGFLSVAKRRFM